MLLSTNYPLPFTVTYFDHFLILRNRNKIQDYEQTCSYGEYRGQTNAVISTVTFIIHVRIRTPTVSFISCDCVMKSHNLYQRM